MTVGNGPAAGWMISTPLLEGFVQFYLGTLLHVKGVYPSHMGGQRSHRVAWGRCILVNGGQDE